MALDEIPVMLDPYRRYRLYTGGGPPDEDGGFHARVFTNRAC